MAKRKKGGGQSNRRGRSASEPLAAQPADDQPLPDWRPLEGALYFRNQLARRRGRKSAALEESLLAAFAEANWAHAIANPFTDPYEGEAQLIEAVRRLNNHMLVATLRFHAYENGRIAAWEDCNYKAKTQE